MCNDPSHYAAIDTMYNAIVEALNTASECLCSRKVPSHKQIAGWNEICSDLHSSARDAFYSGSTVGSLDMAMYYT